MKSLTSAFLLLLLMVSCSNPVKKEMRPLVKAINEKITDIDTNHRVQIIEDDYVTGDTLMKIRGYSMDDNMLKVVSYMSTSHFERDDYFYFDDGHVIFSGHLENDKDEYLAAEYKYYYDKDKIVESLFWKDHYEPGKRFPHESFQEFEPNMDSLLNSERSRIAFLTNKLMTEGFVIKHLNEHLQAN